MKNYKSFKYVFILILILGLCFSVFKIFTSSAPKAEFVTDAAGNYLFQTKNAKAFEASFGQEENMPDMVFKTGDSEIRITIPYQNAKWEKTDKGLRAISDGIIYDYSIIKNNKEQPAGIKEEITLNQPTNYSSFIFPTFFKNLNPEKIDGIWKFFDNNRQEQFYIPKPFMIDANNNRSEDVEIEVSVDGKFISITPDADWLNSPQRKYPIIIDPTFKISVLDVYSHPQQGQNWEVEFITEGEADLKIIPNDQATIDDDEFVGLWCGDQKQNPKILAGDIIYYPNWQCSETGKVVHYTKKAGHHTLRFEFENQVAYAYNAPSSKAGDFTSTNAFYWSNEDLSAYAGSDVGSTPYSILLTDATGKTALGYIGAVGAGETLSGTELVHNGNMEADTTWGLDINTPTTNERSATQAHAGTYSRHVVTDAGYEGIEEDTTWPIMTAGYLYKVNIWIYPVTGDDFLWNNGWEWTTQFSISSFGSWQLKTYYYGVLTNGEWRRIRFMSENAVSEWYVDDISVQRVTDPSSTGVHIVSALNGTTRAWASIDTGFDQNTITTAVVSSTATVPNQPVDINGGIININGGIINAK